MTDDEVIGMLIDKGLSIRKAEDICLLLRYKPEKVRTAFIMRCKGHMYWRIASELDVAVATVWKYVNVNCSDIADYLFTNK